MKTTLNFEDKETKKLLSKLDFKYFLDQNIEDEQYDNNSIEKLNHKYSTTLNELKKKSKGSQIQHRYYLEGQVRKMFTGGLLPAMFHLDESRTHSFIDFEGVGEAWAYFSLWQKLYKRKLLLEKVWDNVIKIGSILGIILSIIKLVEVFPKFH